MRISALALCLLLLLPMGDGRAQQDAPLCIAAETACLLLGAEHGVRITRPAQETAYRPAAVAPDGRVLYGEQEKAGVYLILEDAAGRIRIVYDAQTGRPVHLQRKFFAERQQTKPSRAGSMTDEEALAFGQSWLAQFPGCGGMQMRLSRQSDGRYAEAFARTAHGWHVSVRIDKVRRCVCALEWIGDEHAAPIEDMILQKPPIFP